MRDRDYLPDVTVRGVVVKVWTERDSNAEAPWANGDDGRGVVADSVGIYGWPEGVYEGGNTIRRLGHGNGRTARYFNVTATLAKAKAEGWGVQNDAGLTPDQILQAAVEAEYVYLDEW